MIVCSCFSWFVMGKEDKGGIEVVLFDFVDGDCFYLSLFTGKE